MTYGCVTREMKFNFGFQGGHGPLRETGEATTRKGRGSHKARLGLEISVVTICGVFDKGPSQPTAIL
ncbi:hypothetical protein PVK06_011776 [Gossypium arboreum]|uniref:Uncharacterized protein n=1 Tax=Gossypium arboreum TaxID=29729 RepID=A0ABR0Q9V5_GOSAR|nr:hypothetical protein PVK06_011776 [Gossypium arboreum]